jgi:hypothetical protein
MVVVGNFRDIFEEDRQSSMHMRRQVTHQLYNFKEGSE